MAVVDIVGIVSEVTIWNQIIFTIKMFNKT